MNKLLLSAGKVGDLAYIKYYLRSFPGSVPDAVEQYFKDHNLPILLQGMSLAEMHSHILKVWQEHCLEKRVSKDFKRH